MLYSFRCNRCNRTVYVDIKVDEYDGKKDKQFCPFCTGETKMERVIEWDGMATNLGGYSDVGGTAGWQR